MPVIDKLHQDHIHIARLLDFIDAEVAKAGTAEHPDFELLSEVMCYMTRFPDLYHHPYEDRIFERLRSTGAVEPSEIDAVEEEHVTIIEHGIAFRDMLDAILRTQGVSVDRFVDTAMAYSRLQRDHLDREEGHLFRAARQHLTAQDWAEFDAAYEAAPDPLFGSGTKNEYGNLAAKLQA